MLRYYDGTVFNSGADAMVNTVNTVGVMGAGIALEYRLRYPDMYLDYKIKCEKKKIKVGKVDYYETKDLLIINFPTKAHFKYPSKLIWIEQGLQNFAETYKDHNVGTIAFPKLGTSNGGLDWETVNRIMEKYLSGLAIDIIICLDEKGEAEGIELKMLNIFNGLDLSNITKDIKLTMKQKEIISKNTPLNRFWRISKLDSVGIKTYENLYNHIYKQAITKSDFKGIQQSFLD